MSWIRSTFFAAFVLAVLVFGFAAAPAHAQDNSSVNGVVTDPSGALVAGASVTLSNASIGYSETKATNSIGAYEFSNVPPDKNYSLEITKAGFATTTLFKIVLNVGSKETRDVQLQIGDTKISVEVTASAAESLNTTDATISSGIDGDRIQDLPNSLVNNAANYLALAPGATPSGEVAGTRSDQTNITLDGLDVNDQRGGFAFVTTVNTPLDSIQEFKVTSTGDDATYGHSAGGQMELVTKGGTNSFHGQGFEYNRTTAYTANNFFNNLNGIPNPQLIRNQFGGDIGGPVVKKKLFFFFSYNGLRSVEPLQNYDTVPVPSFYNGQLAYVNTANQVVLTPTSGPNSVAALDPAGMGADQDLLNFFKTRGYAGTSALPAPNTTAVGDGLNTSGYFFNSPQRNNDNTYIGRVDYQISTNHRLFVRFTIDRQLDGGFGNEPVQVFPSDPDPSSTFLDHSRAWVVGETWSISPNVTNQASFGETDQINSFVVNQHPTLPNDLNFYDGFIGEYIVTNPYLGLNQQFPVVPVYQGRDTVTWVKGKHILQFGGVVAPTIFKSGNLTAYNTDSIGIGGDISGLTPAQRPSDFNAQGDTSEWDRTFLTLLGRYSAIASGYNYDKQGNPLPQGQVVTRDYHSTQYEAFAQDSWSIRPDFTMTYGVRWSFHKPLTEVNGYEAIQNQTPESIFSVRLANSAAGISGPFASPLITYREGGSANNAPGYYKPSYNNFAPRIGFAYSPSATGGMLGRLFGNRETSIRAGFGLDFDNNLIGQGFELDETSFLFSDTPTTNFGDPASDPRFACPSPCSGTVLASHFPAPTPAGTSPRPTYTPNLDANGIPVGFAEGGFGSGSMFNFDPNYKTPYEMHYSFGIQRHLPGDWLVEADYVGKQGRRLPALGDPAQTLNFVDKASGQSFYDAFGKVQKQVQTGAPVTAQPWFENQMGAALAQIGATCPEAGNLVFGVPTNCTQFANDYAGFYFGDGDTSSLIETLADASFTGNPEQTLLLPNVGLPAQDGAQGFIGNYSSSGYNALIVRVNHRMSHDLTMELNYSYSHSIDNDSGVQNNLIDFNTSEICDLRNLRVCRGSSDFDRRHVLAASFEYGLPFGQGKWIGHDMGKGLDEIFGGWHVSGIATAYSGEPFKVDSGAFTIDFTQTQPAVFIGSRADVKQGIQTVVTGGGQPNTIQYFSNPVNALSAFTAPIAGGPGTRNILSGPSFWNVDMAILKDFKMPWSDSHRLQFRVDGLNVFNHTNFSNPAQASGPTSIIDPSTFGNIISTADNARVVQLGLRYIF